MESTWDGVCLRLDRVGGPLAVCTDAGEVVGLTPSGRALFASLGVDASLPFPLPPTLRASLFRAPAGVATEWCPTDGNARLGCTRYDAGGTHHVILMREVSEKQRELSRRLHQQRLEAMGRLVSTIAHDLRSALGPIVFDVNVLLERGEEMPRDELMALAREIADASGLLKKTIDDLLDFARLGPPSVESVNVGESARHAAALLRGVLRERNRSLDLACAASAEALGNPMTIEQSLINLMLNAAECDGGARVLIEVTSEGERVVVRVHDDGAGVPEGLDDRIFEPFFSTKPHGTGLGLSAAREAVRDLGGDVTLERPGKLGGATFAMTLPVAPPASRRER